MSKERKAPTVDPVSDTGATVSPRSAGSSAGHADRLDMAFINSLPQPLMVRFVGDRDYAWPLWDIDVQTGMLRIDVCGKLDVKHIGEAVMFRDDAGQEHDPESFYLEEPGQ